MAFPRLRVPYASRQMTDNFGGYNHNLRIGEGEFYDMKNLCSDNYPLLSTRRPRSVRVPFRPPGTGINGIIAKNLLCYVQGSMFYYGDQSYDLELTDEPKQLVSMGRYVIILPDKKYFDTLGGDGPNADVRYGDIETEINTQGYVSFTPCRIDGIEYSAKYVQSSAPEGPSDGDIWRDTSTSDGTMKQWSSSSSMWVTITPAYVKITSTGVGENFEVNDGIEISGLSDQILHTDKGYAIIDSGPLCELEGSAVVWTKGNDYIVISGMLPCEYTIVETINIARRMPVMDYVIECGNRLWGCRYGFAANGEFVNEIYCSKLGDFKNWSCFMGISTDSWASGVGTDGPFTGAIAHMGYPLFFKENHLHKVYISSVGAHRIVETACRGVQEGSSRSLAIVGETLYYKSRNGICAYDGSLPVEISQALGNEQYTDAVAGAYGNKYYVSMQDAKKVYHLFVYDEAKRMWHKEDNLHADSFCAFQEDLYCAENGANRMLGMLGSGEDKLGPVEWMAESGMIGLSMPDMKYISRLILRLQLPEGSELSCWAEYDSCGRWDHLFTMTGHETKAFTLPVRPVRCDHMRLKLEGIGPMKLFSITKTIEQGSDVR